MNKEFTYGNDGSFSRNDGPSRSQYLSSTQYSQEDFGLKINEGSVSEPSYFSPHFNKPHLDIYSSNRYLDTFLFHRSSVL
jgi:hypothetical protein